MHESVQVGRILNPSRSSHGHRRVRENRGVRSARLNTAGSRFLIYFNKVSCNMPVRRRCEWGNDL